jgi:hypothetical protein
MAADITDQRVTEKRKRVKVKRSHTRSILIFGRPVTRKNQQQRELIPHLLRLQLKKLRLVGR